MDTARIHEISQLCILVGPSNDGKSLHCSRIAHLVHLGSRTKSFPLTIFNLTELLSLLFHIKVGNYKHKALTKHFEFYLKHQFCTIYNKITF
jgi:hypothetical protein